MHQNQTPSASRRVRRRGLMASALFGSILSANVASAAVNSDFDPTPGTHASDTSFPTWRYKVANFSVDNQSVMGANASSFTDNRFVGIEWGSKDFQAKLNLGKKTLQGFMAGELHEGRIGLESKARASGGEVDIDYNASVGFKYDERVTREEDLSIRTKYASLAGSEMSATGVDISYKLDFVTDYKVTYGAGIDTGLTKTWTTRSSSGDNGDKRFDQDDWDNGSLFDRHRNDKTLLSGDGRQTLVEFGPGMSSKEFNLGGIVDGYVQVPDVTTGRDVHSKHYENDLSVKMTSDPFVHMDMDLVSLIAKALPALELLNNDINLSVLNIDYSLFSGNIVADAMLEQTFKLDVHGMDVQIEDLTRGITVEGDGNDTFEFNKPIVYNAGPNSPDEMELDFLATMTLDHTFTAQTDIVMTLDMFLKALAVSVDYDVGVKSGNLLDLGPVFKKDINLAEIRIPLMTKEFEIDGLGEEEYSFSMTSNVIKINGTPAPMGAMMVPEPASAVLMLCGLGLAVRRK